MAEIICEYRDQLGDQPVCQIVASLMDLPLADCHTNDSACHACLKHTAAPQTPNAVVASMAIAAASRTGDKAFVRRTIDRFENRIAVAAAVPVTACVLRGPETRQVACKPCQADSLTPVMVPVFSCPKHKECTLHNTGTFPKIKACATCDDRLEKYYQLDTKPLPAPVLTAIAERVAATKGERGVSTP